MSSGKRVGLPCGHCGTVIIGTFALCPICDAMKPSCPRCGRSCTEPFHLDGLKNLWHCGETKKEDGAGGCGNVFEHPRKP